MLAKDAEFLRSNVYGKTFRDKASNLAKMFKKEQSFQKGVAKKLTLKDFAQKQIKFAKKNNLGKNVGKVRNLANEKGKAFEDFLVKKFGGKGSFKVTSKLDGTREFDGAIGNLWYEAKSGEYWDMLLSNEKKLNKFNSDMIRGLRIAKENGASYKLYSNVLIPQKIKNWLNIKGINYFEFLEGK